MKKYMIIFFALLGLYGCQSWLSHHYSLDIGNEVVKNEISNPIPITVEMQNTLGIIDNWPLITPFGVSGDIYYDEPIPNTLLMSMENLLTNSGYFTIEEDSPNKVIIDITKFQNSLDKIWSGTFSANVQISLRIFDQTGHELISELVEGENLQRNMKGMESLDIAIDNAFTNAISKIPLSDIFNDLGKPITEQEKISIVIKKPIERIYERISQNGGRRIGFLGISENGINSSLYSSIIISEMVIINTDFDLIDRKDLSLIIEEQKLQLSGIIDEDSIVELSKIKGIDILVFGKIINSERVKYIELKILDVETALIIDQQLIEI